MNYNRSIRKSTTVFKAAFWSKIPLRCKYCKKGRWFLDIKKYFNKETIRYILVGSITAMINLSVYFALNMLFSINYLVSNLVAWMVTVSFAYVANKLFVFKIRSRSKSGLLREFAFFVNSRLFSGAVEQLLLWSMVGICCFNSSAIKLFSSSVVVSINYFVSLIIFKRKCKNRRVANEYSDIR